MIIATPRILYFALGMLAMLLAGVSWIYGLPLIGYVAWKVQKKANRKLATPFISGFVATALFMSPVLWIYILTAYAQWSHIVNELLLP